MLHLQTDHAQPPLPLKRRKNRLQPPAVTAGPYPVTPKLQPRITLHQLITPHRVIPLVAIIRHQVVLPSALMLTRFTTAAAVHRPARKPRSLHLHTGPPPFLTLALAPHHLRPWNPRHIQHQLAIHSLLTRPLRHTRTHRHRSS